MTAYGAPQPQQRSGEQLPLFDLIGAGLGVLAFIWGFLDWYGVKGGAFGGSATAKGYATGAGGAAAAIGLSVLAGAVAAIVLVDKKAKGSLVPLAASVASLLVTFGLMVGKEKALDIKIGLILMLITAVAQVGVFVAGWLQAEGKIMAGSPAAAAGQQWGSAQQWGGYQQQAYPQTPAQPQYGQPPAQPQQPQQPQYGQPTQQPQYGQPTQHQQPQGYPQQPPSNPYGQG
jgi:Family of unknown function (DUF5336)